MDGATVLARTSSLAARFAQERAERQQRRDLVAEDFVALSQAGYQLTGVLAEQGGLWQSPAHSTRLIAELVRTIAQGDASVALVCAMHPAVLALWLTTPQAEATWQPAWTAQRRLVSELARSGAWWGTLTSEPGSGGDLYRTATLAQPDQASLPAPPTVSSPTPARPAGPLASAPAPERATPTAAIGRYRLNGQKHFGSGAGVAAYMMTTALPVGESEPDLFFLELDRVPWDGSTGLTLTAPWDGHGMIATQSHAFRLDGFPAQRAAWPGQLRRLVTAGGVVGGCGFTAVIVGIVQAALATAERQLARRRATLRPFEQVEWTRAGLEGWLIEQAYAGMLHAVEYEAEPQLSILRGKTAVAELATSLLERLCRIMGGGAYGRSSPFGHWAQDVRALGFLRPPWGLAYETLAELGWSSSMATPTPD